MQKSRARVSEVALQQAAPVGFMLLLFCLLASSFPPPRCLLIEMSSHSSTKPVILLLLLRLNVIIGERQNLTFVAKFLFTALTQLYG